MPILGTQSLSQLVAIRPEVAGRVDARKTFHDAGAGQRLQARFFPLAPQVEALRAAAEAAVKGGCMLFAGSPGTGKSMLLFLLGKALSAPFPGDEFSHLLDKIKEPRALRSLGAARKAGQQWLVVYPTASEKEDFDQSVRQALNGALFNQGVTDFAPQAGARLREDFAETATHLKSHREFQGIAVLFDGMDDFIDELLEEPGSPVSEQVRDFCAFCAESRFPIFFLGVVERELGLFTVEQESQLLKLFPAIQPVTLLGQPGEWEELVSSMVLEHVPGENWNELVNHADMKEVLSSLVRVGLYSGFSERWVKEVVLEGSYPLHPAALFALPRVALRLATASRTAFTFLSDPAPGGLVYFLNNFAVAQPNGRLSMYTADSLFTYFEKSLTDDPHNADFLQTLQKSMMLAGDIPQARRLLRLVLIFQMVSHERLRTRQDDLIWALHVGEREERIARRSLDLLVQKGALRHVEATQEYLLPLERPSITLDEALPRVKNRLRGELDVAALLLRRFPPPRVEARAFNLKHNTDRAVFGRYLRASELEDPQALLTQVRELAGRPRPYKGDLMVAYVLAENASDVERVRGACREGALSHPRLVVALTKEPRDFGNEALNILALERLKATEPPFSDPTSRERKELEERLAAAQKLLEERFRDMLRAENLEYYYQGRREDLPDEDSFHHYCNLRVAELLGEPPVLRERSLTCLADRGRSRAERQAALNYLLSCRGPLALRSDAGAVGRILRAGLLESGIFESAGVVGVWENFQLAHNPPNRGLAKAYRHLVDQIAGKDETHRWVPVAPLITGLLEPPFSLTPAMVELLLAVLVWRWRRQLHLYRNARRAQAEGRPELRERVEPSAELLFEMLADPEDWVMEYAEARPEEGEVLVALVRQFAPDFRPQGAISIWEVAARTLVDWFADLPPAARSLAPPEAAGLVELLAAPEATADPYDLLQNRLPAALGLPRPFSWSAHGPELLARLATARRAAEGVVPGLLRRLRQGLENLWPFPSERPWPERVRRWYSALSEDVHEAPASPDARRLLEVCTGKADPDSAVEELVGELGYFPVALWCHDYCEEILARLDRVYQELEWHEFLGLYPLAGSEERVRSIIMPILRRSGLPPQDLEELLVAELERVSWPDGPPQPGVPLLAPRVEEVPAPRPDQAEPRAEEGPAPVQAAPSGETAAPVQAAEPETPVTPGPEAPAPAPAEGEAAAREPAAVPSGGEDEDLSLQWL